jgi:hypothetical protein
METLRSGGFGATPVDARLLGMTGHAFHAASGNLVLMAVRHPLAFEASPVLGVVLY